ncbi:uncharacterized protein I303_105554 [Kwoniella dejecticola CBS 10117]|uniref:Phytanoyl-CoA dioxygenase n=1 Tax=Kwoniella dejecticola CBS 10117 TaxID=1296121 RepID=A0A1A6A251_9TREE|nr:uncharacterized protein I303_05003 [Kwoniella dejecticola CBS 10117]OBR84146.1 hypothetical protein I303_05003 [Kwoniella dejecticola CBS 10117]
MPSTTTTQTTTHGNGNTTSGILKLRGHGEEDYLPELKTRGWTVVKNVIPADRAKAYEDRAYRWLESFGKGFDQEDRSTWKVDNLPYFSKGGLFNRHGAPHEQWAWDIRSEEGIIDTFANIWGTDELLVSFDGVNVSLPFKNEDLGDRGTPWPHVDQSPNRRGKECIQGIANLAENGPNDGGLMILDGSFGLYTQYFDEHPHLKPEGGWDWRDSYSYPEETLKWFEERGCKWKKIEAGPGDLILWDSRTVHYGDAARGDRARVATYVCYKPAKEISAEKLEERKMALKEYAGTSHDPINFRLTGTNISGPLSDDETQIPRQPAVLSDRAKQLAGIVAY